MIPGAEGGRMGDAEARTIATNRRARHDYFIEDRLEAGLELKGTEVKSLRAGNVSLREAFARIEEDGQVWMHGMHIAPYEAGRGVELDPVRSRRLLLHRQEIRRLKHRVERKGYTLVPLRLYFRRGYAKVELGLGRGKARHDKREAIRERDAQRDLERSMSERQ
jgi:SsrA-binding protein